MKKSSGLTRGHMSNMTNLCLCIVLILTLFCWGSNEALTNITPYVVLSGSDSKIAEPNYFRITSPQEWNRLWFRHMPPMSDSADGQSGTNPPSWMFEMEGVHFSGVPYIDFKQCMVVAVCLGKQSKDINVAETKILETPEEIQFVFSTNSTVGQKKDRCGYHFYFYVIARIDKPLVIKEIIFNTHPAERKRWGRIQPYLRPVTLYTPKELDLIEYFLKKELSPIFKDMIHFIDMNHEEDPPEEFFNRFTGLGFRFKKFSASNGYNMSGIRDRQTGERGVIIYARILQWLDDTKAQVESGYYLHGLGGSKLVQIAELKDGQWIATKIVHGYHF